MPQTLQGLSAYLMCQDATELRARAAQLTLLLARRTRAIERVRIEFPETNALLLRHALGRLKQERGTRSTRSRSTRVVIQPAERRWLPRERRRLEQRRARERQKQHLGSQPR